MFKNTPRLRAEVLCISHFVFRTSGTSKNSTKTIYLASYGSPAPLQNGSCGGDSASFSEPIFEPVKRATFQIASGGAAQRCNHSN